MREPTGATPGTSEPEPADVRSDSDAMQTVDTSADHAAARMEQVIDQFVGDWDREDRAQVDESASAPLATIGDGETGLAPHSFGGPQWLPRIVTSSLPSRSPGLPDDDYWRRQLLDALSEADDDVPTELASPPPLAFFSRLELARTRRDQTAPERRHQHLTVDREASPFATRWRTAQHLVVAAVAATCVFSTGVLWATHRSETVGETGGQPAELAAAIPESSAVGGAVPRRSIRNKPVLIREAETFTFAPGLAAASWRQVPPADPLTATVSASAPSLPRLINGGEATHPLPIAPIAPVVRLVPVVPIEAVVALVPSAAAVASGPSIADAIASPPPPLDREGLTALAARPANAPDRARASMRRAEPQRRAATKPPQRRKAAHGSAPARRLSSGSAPSRAVAQKAARGAVPAAAWEMKRRGLRVPPEPEPSPLKKLIGLVWPPGQSSTTPVPPKRAGPAVTTTMPAHSWSDSARANP